MKKMLVIIMLLAMLCSLAGCKSKTSDTEKGETAAVEIEHGNLNGRPWENSGKPLEEYTWEEYLEWNGNLQEAFYEAFESAEAFEKWLSRVNPEESTQAETFAPIEKPWENGGKPIEEYTWEEFDSLSGELQEAFFEAFVSAEDFEAWMIRVKPEESTQVDETTPMMKPWENGGKTVDAYTWEEFEALTAELQEAFFEAFESAEEFEAWETRVKPEEDTQIEETIPLAKPWENGGKPVEEYTWEEFEALTAELQEAFFEAFESAAAFESWMKKAKV